jgi:hypothetical protein
MLRLVFLNVENDRACSMHKRNVYLKRSREEIIWSGSRYRQKFGTAMVV